MCFSFQLLFVFDGINRIRLEFKGYQKAVRDASLVYGINRIRLEFKVRERGDRSDRERSINRIRLEFKGKRLFDTLEQYFVLIESDWNLKQ